MKRGGRWIVASVGAGLAAAVLAALWSGGVFTPPLSPQEKIGTRWLRPPGSEAAYAGTEACRSCHAREFAAHSHSPHSRTVRELVTPEPRPEFDSTQAISDPVNQVTYSVRNAEGKSWLLARRGAKTQQATPHWVFGSGTHAWSYLGAQPSGFLEFRLTYYSTVKQWNFTPGRGPDDPLVEPAGHPYTPLEAAACFGCHSTLLVGTREGLDFQRSQLNVGCESCHGPGRRHVESARRHAASGASPARADEIARPPRPTGEQVLRICGACHRLTSDVQPGNPEFETQLSRFPGAALTRSRCYIASEGKLSCTTCHNPHERAARDPEAYDRACRSCHQEPQGSTCAAGKTARCVTCHMLPEQVGRKLPLVFHNHWIRRPRDEDLLGIARRLSLPPASTRG